MGNSLTHSRPMSLSGIIRKSLAQVSYLSFRKNRAESDSNPMKSYICIYIYSMTRRTRLEQVLCVIQKSENESDLSPRIRTYGLVHPTNKPTRRHYTGGANILRYGDAAVVLWRCSRHAKVPPSPPRLMRGLCRRRQW